MMIMIVSTMTKHSQIFGHGQNGFYAGFDQKQIVLFQFIQEIKVDFASIRSAIAAEVVFAEFGTKVGFLLREFIGDEGNSRVTS